MQLHFGISAINRLRSDARHVVVQRGNHFVKNVEYLKLNGFIYIQDIKYSCHALAICVPLVQERQRIGTIRQVHMKTACILRVTGYTWQSQDHMTR